MMQTAGILGARDRHRFKAMVAVAFFGFLCPSKLCMTDAEHYLRVKDVRFTDFNLHHCRLKPCSSKHSRRPAVVKVQLKVFSVICISLESSKSNK